MKLAKKMLACLVVLTLIGSLALTAFAADAALGLSVGEVDENNEVKVSILLKNAAGVNSADLVLEFDTEVFSYVKAASGADAKEIGAMVATGNPSEEPNTATASFILMEEILTAAEYAAEEQDVNVDNFEVAVVTLKVVDGATATDSALTLKANSLQVNEAAVTVGDVTSDVALVEETTEEATDAPTETTTEEAETIAPTGLTSGEVAISAAAGVIAVAGAAFVVTKKKK